MLGPQHVIPAAMARHPALHRRRVFPDLHLRPLAHAPASRLLTSTTSPLARLTVVGLRLALDFFPDSGAPLNRACTTEPSATNSSTLRRVIVGSQPNSAGMAAAGAAPVVSR